MSTQPQIGDTANVIHTVTAADTASAVGSGDLEVLGTPVLLAWCEAATCAALDLDNTFTSVGTKVTISHVAPSGVGAIISATATVVLADGHAISFEVVAVDQDGNSVGHVQIKRAIVDPARFMSRVSR